MGGACSFMVIFFVFFLKSVRLCSCFSPALKGFECGPHRHHQCNKQQHPISIDRFSYGCGTLLMARTAKSEPLQKTDISGNEAEMSGGSDNDDEMVVVPFNGLIGQENGQIFEKPLEQFDAAQTPTKNTEDMPGLPGSDERNEAIMNRIKERVADLKLKDEWRNDDDDFGKNPLRNVAITEVMFEQLKVIRPFESFSDFILTLCLLMFTTGFLTIFVDFNNNLDELFIEWWGRSDFDMLGALLR